MNFIANTVETFHYRCIFNPIGKIIEIYTEKEELYKGKQKPYERMIQEKNDLIDKLLNT
ncbi:hypothetical protein [Apibacter mensalis]|uniref:hypothetical protein n=1 Tax=Apibacter mensalis TaxID=1586267 RepID=UPI0012E1C3AB|nr:hypothetical protein [Apibacter mensalis]